MAKKDNTTSSRFEVAIWSAADKLRGNLNASEYEGVVLVLVYIALHMNSINETAVGSTEECRFQAVDAVMRQVVGNRGIDAKLTLLRLCGVCLAVSSHAEEGEQQGDDAMLVH